MSNKMLVDTDVIIDYLRNYQKAVDFIEKEPEKLCLSAITVAELYAGVREGKERSILKEFIQAFTVIPVDAEISSVGGLYRRDYGKSHGVGLADAIIAASAESVEAKLVTLNKKHYPMLKSVVIPYKKNQ